VPAGTKHYGHTSRLTAGSNPHFPGMRFLVYAGRRRAGAVSRGAVGVRVRGKGDAARKGRGPKPPSLSREPLWGQHRILLRSGTVDVRVARHTTVTGPSA